MVLWAAILILQGAGFAGSMAGVPGIPENITVMFLNPTTVQVSWSINQVEQVEKYDVTYKPTDTRNNQSAEALDANYNETYSETFTLNFDGPYETFDQYETMVQLVAGNSDAVTLSDLQADTQYQLVIIAVRAGKKYRSRPIVFRTLEPPRTSPQQDAAATGAPSTQPQGHIQVRGVEVGIVVMVLIVWAGAIALFFNRWGKIRMLLPYQPDYKEQLKVPGTGVYNATNTTCNQHSTQHTCSQHLHWSNHRVDSLDSTTGVGGGVAWPRSSRPRINSAIDVAGFLSQEFLRRHGSTSRLCRKVRSADNLPLATSDHQSDHRLSQEKLDSLIQTTSNNNKEDNQQEELESARRKNSFEIPQRDSDISLIEPYPPPLQSSPSSSFRDSTSLSSAGRRFGWRNSTSHEYVRCPIRQPASVDEKCYRRSCEPDFPKAVNHRRLSPSQRLFHHSTDKYSKSCEYTKYTPETSGVGVVNISGIGGGSSGEVQHFGLPILSISEPSPPDERDRLDEYL